MGKKHVRFGVDLEGVNKLKGFLAFTDDEIIAEVEKTLKNENVTREQLQLYFLVEKKRAQRNNASIPYTDEEKELIRSLGDLKQYNSIYKYKYQTALNTVAIKGIYKIVDQNEKAEIQKINNVFEEQAEKSDEELELNPELQKEYEELEKQVNIENENEKLNVNQDDINSEEKVEAPEEPKADQYAELKKEIIDQAATISDTLRKHKLSKYGVEVARIAELSAEADSSKKATAEDLKKFKAGLDEFNEVLGSIVPNDENLQKKIDLKPDDVEKLQAEVKKRATEINAYQSSKVDENWEVIDVSEKNEIIAAIIANTGVELQPKKGLWKRVMEKAGKLFSKKNSKNKDLKAEDEIVDNTINEKKPEEKADAEPKKKLEEKVEAPEEPKVDQYAEPKKEIRDLAEDKMGNEKMSAKDPKKEAHQVNPNNIIARQNEVQIKAVPEKKVDKGEKTNEKPEMKPAEAPEQDKNQISKASDVKIEAEPKLEKKEDPAKPEQVIMVQNELSQDMIYEQDQRKDNKKEVVEENSKKEEPRNTTEKLENEKNNEFPADIKKQEENLDGKLLNMAVKPRMVTNEAKQRCAGEIKKYQETLAKQSGAVFKKKDTIDLDSLLQNVILRQYGMLPEEKSVELNGELNQLREENRKKGGAVEKDLMKRGAEAVKEAGDIYQRNPGATPELAAADQKVKSINNTLCAICQNPIGLLILLLMMAANPMMLMGIAALSALNSEPVKKQFQQLPPQEKADFKRKEAAAALGMEKKDIPKEICEDKPMSREQLEEIYNYMAWMMQMKQAAAIQKKMRAEAKAAAENSKIKGQPKHEPGTEKKPMVQEESKKPEIEKKKETSIKRSETFKKKDSHFKL